MRFEIGQKIWIGEFTALAPDYEICPDCGGTGRLRVTFHDETQVSIECQNCAPGYDPPTGRVVVYRNKARARQAVVSGFENALGKIRWHVDSTYSGYRIVDDEDAFETEEKALAWAEARSEKYEQEQRAKIATKEKDTRTWAWNASYHRRCIKEAERQIAYHTAKLSVAALKAKTAKLETSK
jgi:hypothetical protein